MEDKGHLVQRYCFYIRDTLTRSGTITGTAKWSVLTKNKIVICGKVKTEKNIT